MKGSLPVPRSSTPSPWPAPCSILTTASPGWACCALPGAASRLKTFTCLTSADDPELLSRPVPELLAERLRLLSEEGRPAAERVLAQSLAPRPLCAPPSPPHRSEPGSSRSGCAWAALHCVDPTAHANLDLLWSCLDSLPTGEQDLLGPALAAALDKSDRPARPRRRQRLRRPADDHPQVQGPGVRSGHRARPAGRLPAAAALRCSPGSSAAFRRKTFQLSPTLPRRSPSSWSRPSAQGRRSRHNQAMGRSRLSRTRSAGDAPHSLCSRHPRPRRAAPLRPACLQKGERRLLDPRRAFRQPAGHRMARVANGDPTAIRRTENNSCRT